MGQPKKESLYTPSSPNVKNYDLPEEIKHIKEVIESSPQIAHREALASFYRALSLNLPQAAQTIADIMSQHSLNGLSSTLPPHLDWQELRNDAQKQAGHQAGIAIRKVWGKS